MQETVTLAWDAATQPGWGAPGAERYYGDFSTFTDSPTHFRSTTGAGAAQDPGGGHSAPRSAGASVAGTVARGAPRRVSGFF